MIVEYMNGISLFNVHVCTILFENKIMICSAYAHEFDEYSVILLIYFVCQHYKLRASCDCIRIGKWHCRSVNLKISFYQNPMWLLHFIVCVAVMRAASKGMHAGASK